MERAADVTDAPTDVPRIIVAARTEVDDGGGGDET